MEGHWLTDKEEEMLARRLGFGRPPFRLDYENFRTDFGIGVIGLHWVMQILHLPAYRAARFRVEAACETDEAKTAAFLAKGMPVGPVGKDFRELIRRDGVEVIDCCFGHRADRQHKRMEVVEAAAAAGKPLVIHKPVAVSLALAERMAAVAEQAGIRLCVNQNCRYNPANYSIKQLLSPERLGRPRVIELRHYWVGARDRGLARGLPAWLNHTVHHADLIRWWTGSACVSVYARADSRATVAVYEFADGTVAYHHENHSGANLHETKIRVMAEKGFLEAGHNWNWHVPSARGLDFVTVHNDPKGEPVALPLPEHVYEPWWSDINPFLPRSGPYYDLAAPVAGMMGSMGSMMRGVAEGTEPDNAIRFGIEALRMHLAAELSIRTGRAEDPRSIPADATAEAA